MGQLLANAIQTRLFKEDEDLLSFILETSPRLKEFEILAISSKIVSLAEGRLALSSEINKKDLIEQEADVVLGDVGYGHTLTISRGILIPAAGIDLSNSPDGRAILYPIDPWKSARTLWEGLKSNWKLDSFGVILVDSHSVPLRRGVQGISLAHFGFKGVKNCMGELDLYGRPLKFTYQNKVDALAGAAVLLMGESRESTPLCVLATDDLEFFPGEDQKQLLVAPEDDLYLALLKNKSLKN